MLKGAYWMDSWEEPHISLTSNYDGKFNWGVVNICIYVHACVFCGSRTSKLPLDSSHPDVLISPVISTATIYVNVSWFNIAIPLLPILITQCMFFMSDFIGVVYRTCVILDRQGVYHLTKLCNNALFSLVSVRAASTD